MSKKNPRAQHQRAQPPAPSRATAPAAPRTRADIAEITGDPALPVEFAPEWDVVLATIQGRGYTPMDAASILESLIADGLVTADGDDLQWEDVEAAAAALAIALPGQRAAEELDWSRTEFWPIENEKMLQIASDEGAYGIVPTLGQEDRSVVKRGSRRAGESAGDFDWLVERISRMFTNLSDDDAVAVAEKVMVEHEQEFYAGEISGEMIVQAAKDLGIEWRSVDRDTSRRAAPFNAVMVLELARQISEAARYNLDTAKVLAAHLLKSYDAEWFNEDGTVDFCGDSIAGTMALATSQVPTGDGHGN